MTTFIISEMVTVLLIPAVGGEVDVPGLGELPQHGVQAHQVDTALLPRSAIHGHVIWDTMNRYIDWLPPSSPGLQYTDM